MAKTPDPIDVEVGAKIKARRRLLGMSQDGLANILGVTFQQVQKYEKGTNRISSSRLAVVANAFGVPPSYFFPTEPGRTEVMTSSNGSELVSFLETNEGRDLNVAFVRISSPKMRRKIVGLVTALAATSHTGGSDPGK